VAEEIGLPDAERDVRTLLARGIPVDRSLLERIAGAKGVPLEVLLPFEGKSLREFRSQAVCGGLLLRHGATGSNERLAHAPMAFQSALAGVMLAAEIVQHVQGKHSVDRTRTEIDLLRPLGMHLSNNDAKHPIGRCLCQDPDFMGVYNEKYATSG
jgi:hypothetical protein